MSDVVFRLKFWFEVQMQGVDLSHQTVTLAMGIDVSCTVQNLPDRRVYLRAKGDESKVIKFQKEVQSELKHICTFQPIGKQSSGALN